MSFDRCFRAISKLNIANSETDAAQRFAQLRMRQDDGDQESDAAAGVLRGHDEQLVSRNKRIGHHGSSV